MAVSGDPAPEIRPEARRTQMQPPSASAPHTEAVLLVRRRGRGWRGWLLRIHKTMPRLFGLRSRPKGSAEPGVAAGVMAHGSQQSRPASAPRLQPTRT